MEINKQIRNCSFCSETKANYSCPRCGHNYCSKRCYNSEKHLTCSEMFYRKCVEDELKLRSKETNDDDKLKKRTLEIIKREYESLIEEEDFDDLKVRFDKIHLQNENELWSNLSEEEKANFSKLLRHNEIVNLLPVDCWTPWYLKVEQTNCLIELIDRANGDKQQSDVQQDKNELINNIETNLNKSNFKVPEIKLPIKKLIELTKVSPSCYLKCTVINILFAYCYMCRKFNNDHLLFAGESFDLIDEISLLNRNSTIFTSTRQSIQFTIQLLINNHKIKTQFILILIDDLKHILEHKNKIYLNIISDFIRLTRRHRQNLRRASNSVEETTQTENAKAEPFLNKSLESQKLKDKNLGALTKKLEYYLSYSNENRDCLIEQINEIEIERLYLLNMQKSIDSQLEDSKGEIKIY